MVILLFVDLPLFCCTLQSNVRLSEYLVIVLRILNIFVSDKAALFVPDDLFVNAGGDIQFLFYE